MAVMTTGGFGKLLWPGLNEIWGLSYKEWPKLYLQMFDYNKSSKHYEEDQNVTGFGLVPVKNEGSAIQFDSMAQAYLKRYTHIAYGMGFIITREIYEDDLYGTIGQQRTQGLSFSMRQTIETVAANVFNRAFTSGYTGADGSILCITSHANQSGGTWANTFTTAADLSEAALEQASIDVSKLENDRGLKINLQPMKLIIPPDLKFEAFRILKSVLQNDTANNAINALRASGTIPGEPVVNPFLTDVDAWFIKTNCPSGVKVWERRAPEFTGVPENDFDTENAKYKGTCRYSFGWTDARAIFGSAGA